MVGVAGKYKGCNTCRNRRVKCDNERPLCRKCRDSGRECAGYEREMVFITSTPKELGRCSSHPRRTSRGKTTKTQKTEPEERPLELVPAEPFMPAWDDFIALSNFGTTYQVQLAALHTRLDNTMRQGEDAKERRFTITLAPYAPPDVRPTFSDDDFDMKSQCLIHLFPKRTPSASEEIGIDDSICLFLYEHNSSILFNNLPPWQDPAAQSNAVRSLGPNNFKAFPGHHFFVRVYRHNAIFAAILNRKTTFLSGPEWSAVPWEQHPKSSFDRLLDITVFLPSILSRADMILVQDPTLSRRLQAQDLLGNCLTIETHFGEWYQNIISFASQQAGQVYWSEESEGRIPFADPLAFGCAMTAMMFIYYWTSLIPFYQVVVKLHEAILQPVVDAYPQPYPNSPATMLVDQIRYGDKQVRDLASYVCRSLDFALNSTRQPDMLVAPLLVVEEVFREISAATGTGDGPFEIMWCDEFRGRLVTKGQDIADVVQSHRWTELATY